MPTIAEKEDANMLVLLNPDIMVSVAALFDPTQSDDLQGLLSLAALHPQYMNRLSDTRNYKTHDEVNALSDKEKKDHLEKDREGNFYFNKAALYPNLEAYCDDLKIVEDVIQDLLKRYPKCLNQDVILIRPENVVYSFLGAHYERIHFPPLTLADSALNKNGLHKINFLLDDDYARLKQSLRDFLASAAYRQLKPYYSSHLKLWTNFTALMVTVLPVYSIYAAFIFPPISLAWALMFATFFFFIPRSVMFCQPRVDIPGPFPSGYTSCVEAFDFRTVSCGALNYFENVDACKLYEQLNCIAGSLEHWK
ncbi:MAG: hypothetical protein NTZ67_04185 [Gammaproteobacteria bacterium]|nr:hypothetical protein [Gammaproteobacteria bacterium]